MGSVSDLQCPARILLARERPDGGLAGERLAGTYDGPVDLDALADRHRGETVLVVGPIPAEHDLGAAVVLVEVDADGLRVSPWDVGHGEVRQT